MAQIIHVCMTCQELRLPAEYAREDAPHLKKDMASHGYCPEHGAQYLEATQRWIEERKKGKGK